VKVMKPIRILQLEDNPTDAELICETLSGAGLVFEALCLEQRDEFVAAIQRGGWDLILADYSLPRFDGQSALSIARETCPEVPFIFVSGSIGEEVAIESLKKGARDYVLKTHLARLVPSVRRAMEEVRQQADQKRLEDHLRQSQKMEAIGQLAGGIAHDFNNLLTAILGYSQILLDRLSEDDPTRFEISEIEAAAKRAARLTRQLLALSRKQVLQPEVLELNAMVGKLQNMLRRLIREDIALSTHLCPELGRIKADPGQLEQIIVNLVVNARDAMPTGGNLTIGTANVDLDQLYADAHPEVRPGRYVALTVSDSGMGMDTATQVRIFEPFFTTKEEGKGTGLGLSTVFGIVKQSNGHITVDSQPGKGTTIKVYLPITNERLEIAETQSAVLESRIASETVLLVEDEAPVRRLVSRILQACGYRVVEAQDGEEAWRQYQHRNGPIHLMLTDVVMPVTSGPDLARGITALDPQIKVLYMSGYTDSAIMRNGVLDPGVAYIQKPFTPGDLARKVREVLDAPSKPGIDPPYRLQAAIIPPNPLRETGCKAF
jgi:two-component system cell cycle sensor histidine kinase/response regulator CckA